ncbi:hypothetical protein CTEN210_00244 [Chaetoceros tenuissimus]|uniref:Uncharacterized protein n=2 Tax=Chaetoceros tenuissimus TaxID=426638 RepID=A0AAD3GYI3_9STRA|nr:hypothetical protein CTEN210_00244 [Chaetoceros tenuissimus]
MFWSRRPGTIEANLRNVKYILEESRIAGFEPPLSKINAWEPRDTEGMRLAIITLKKARVKNAKNAISNTHLQIGTVRKLLSTARVLHAGTNSGEKRNLVLRTIKGETQRFKDGMESSYFLETFKRGMKIRMGLLQRRNVPVTSELVILILKYLEEAYKDSGKEFQLRRRYLLAGTLVSLLYGGSLRGNEGFMLDADALASNIEFGKDADIPHVLAPLYGRFKGETGERFHVIPLVNISRTGIPFRIWLERALAMLRAENKIGKKGPLFCDVKGDLLKSKDLEDLILEAIENVQATQVHSELIPNEWEVREMYGIYRSFRRGAASTAANEDVNDFTIKLVNRWRKYETARGSVPNMGIMEYYLEHKKVLKRILSFSKSL